MPTLLTTTIRVVHSLRQYLAKYTGIPHNLIADFGFMLVSPPTHHLKAHIKPTNTPTPPIDIRRPFPADEVRVVVAAGAGFVPLGLAPVLVTLPVPVPLVPVLVPLPLLPLAVALVLAPDCEVEVTIVTLGQTSSPSLTIHIGVPV